MIFDTTTKAAKATFVGSSTRTHSYSTSFPKLQAHHLQGHLSYLPCVVSRSYASKGRPIVHFVLSLLASRPTAATLYLT